MASPLAWRRALEQRGLNGARIRRKLAALSSLYEYLCDRHAVTHNPVKGGRELGGQDAGTGQARQLGP